MINRLDNVIISKGHLKMGQVNCYNKIKMIEMLFQMDFELLIVQKPGNGLETRNVAVGCVLL